MTSPLNTQTSITSSSLKRSTTLINDNRLIELVKKNYKNLYKVVTNLNKLNFISVEIALMCLERINKTNFEIFLLKKSQSMYKVVEKDNFNSLKVLEMLIKAGLVTEIDVYDIILSILWSKN